MKVGGITVKKKGFVTILELITVALVLLTAFSILFPGFSYKSRWSESMLMVKSRDVILTVDRIDELYNFSFNSKAFDEFLANTFPRGNLVFWPGTEGAVKNSVKIACNCTEEQIANLSSWVRGLKINGREINFVILPSKLDVINPSDVLLIWGYKNLSDPVYLNSLREYLKNENGIVEMMDLNSTLLDDVQRQIFGLGESITGETTRFSEYDVFRESPCEGKPCNASDIIYGPWKYFYHVPAPLFAFSLPPGIPPVDDPDIAGYCDELSNGSLRIQAYVVEEDVEEPYAYQFWICNSSKTYFDTDWNGSADIVVYEGERFNLPNLHNKSENFTFSLNYIDGQEKIGVSFKPEYEFYDFIKHELDYEIVKPGKGPPEHAVAAGLENRFARYHVIAPGDGDLKRILIQAENKTALGEPIPGVILNATPISRVAWIANFTEQGVGDDEELLLTSLLLWASNKRAREPFAESLKIGYVTSYVNVENEDMFEVYRFDFGAGYPY